MRNRSMLQIVLMVSLLLPVAARGETSGELTILTSQQYQKQYLGPVTGGSVFELFKITAPASTTRLDMLITATGSGAPLSHGLRISSLTGTLNPVSLTLQQVLAVEDAPSVMTSGTTFSELTIIVTPELGQTFLAVRIDLLADGGPIEITEIYAHPPAD